MFVAAAWLPMALVLLMAANGAGGSSTVKVAARQVVLRGNGTRKKAC
jgi:hypothetical protein